MFQHLMDMKKILLLLLPFSAFSQFTNELSIPTTIEGTTFALTIDESTRQFFDGTITETIGFNGNFLGPTLIFNQGDDIEISVQNDLDEPTTVHWHGMHVSPEDDGGPHTVIAAGTTWRPDFTVLDRATTFWYHPHLHEKTNEHVTKGAAGMIIIRSDDEAALTLPRTYGEDDIPMIIQFKSFTANNQLDERGDDTDFMVNGTLDPYVELPSQMVRLRLLNGSNERVLNIGFDDDRDFYQIGSDGGLLTAPVTMDRLRLSTGERTEIVVDLSNDNGSTLKLMTYASEFGPGIPGGGGGMAQGFDGQDTEFLEIRVGEQTSNPVTSLPTTLATHTPWEESEADRERTITMEGNGPGNPFNLDNLLFDIDLVNETVLLDDVEIWTITNNTNIGHPFHIHDVQFYILDRDGVSPPENEQGLKDVVFVEGGETVRFITKFEDFADSEVPYMYHCHILPHEDGGMMGQFIVVEEEEVLGLEEQRSKFRIYPNPVTDRIVRVLLPDSVDPSSEVGFKIHDLSGKEVAHFPSKICGPSNLKIIYLEDYKEGIYTLTTSVDGVQASSIPPLDCSGRWNSPTLSCPLPTAGLTTAGSPTSVGIAVASWSPSRSSRCWTWKVPRRSWNVPSRMAAKAPG